MVKGVLANIKKLYYFSYYCCSFCIKNSIKCSIKILKLPLYKLLK